MGGPAQSPRNPRELCLRCPHTFDVIAFLFAFCFAACRKKAPRADETHFRRALLPARHLKTLRRSDLAPYSSLGSRTPGERLKQGELGIMVHSLALQTPGLGSCSWDFVGFLILGPSWSCMSVPCMPNFYALPPARARSDGPGLQGMPRYGLDELKFRTATTRTLS